jgi:hypothetical protein
VEKYPSTACPLTQRLICSYPSIKWRKNISVIIRPWSQSLKGVISCVGKEELGGGKGERGKKIKSKQKEMKRRGKEEEMRLSKNIVYQKTIEFNY